MREKENKEARKIVKKKKNEKKWGKNEAC